MLVQLNLDLHWILISLLIKHCTAETVIAKVVRTKSINLTDLIKCDSWELESSEMSKPLLTEDTSSGAYKCPSSEDAVLLLVYGGFQFVSKIEEDNNVKSSLGIVGQNITLICYMEIYPSNMTMVSSLIIRDESDKELLKVEAPVETTYPSFDSFAESYETATKTGNVTHHCEWTIEVEYEGTKYKETEKMFSTVVIFMPVRNAKPDKTKVKVDEQIRCTAEGDPPPDKFFWQCDSYSDKEDGWKAEEEVLTPTHSKEFVCQCMASNTLAGRVFSVIWNGTIEATGDPKPKGVWKKDKDKKEGKVTKKKEAKAEEKDDDDDDDDGDDEDDVVEKQPRTKRPVASDTTSVHELFAAGVLLLFCSVVVVAAK